MQETHRDRRRLNVQRCKRQEKATKKRRRKGKAGGTGMKENMDVRKRKTKGVRGWETARITKEKERLGDLKKEEAEGWM